MVTTIVKGLEKEKELRFPKLMKLIHGERIVLFVNRTTGTCVSDSKNLKDVGEYCDTYYPHYYKDFNEELTLKNKQ